MARFMAATLKGIVLAGGSGTRMYPLTRSVSKQLLPVYDKPMVYYPLSVLMLAGIRRILLVTTPHEQGLFAKLLEDGSQWGLELEYAVQAEPRGLADAFIVGRRFVGSDRSCLILGDNIFYGHGLTEALRRAAARESGATIFGYWVKDPQRYGVAEFDESGRLLRLVEKPLQSRSHYAVTGLYFYDDQVVEMAAALKPSARGELEITDINSMYLERGQLVLEQLGRGSAWLDTGTHESLIQAANFIETIEARQGLKIACPEEIAFRQGWIDAAQLARLAELYRNNSYGAYLRGLLDGSHAP